MYGAHLYSIHFVICKLILCLQVTEGVHLSANLCSELARQHSLIDEQSDRFFLCLHKSTSPASQMQVRRDRPSRLQRAVKERGE